uniref:Uncharacterized protein n=1 Tax=Amphimedon queenslandica TaxID=400682 RepID=A0A1X7TD90_AMPQE
MVSEERDDVEDRQTGMGQLAACDDWLVVGEGEDEGEDGEGEGGEGESREEEEFEEEEDKREGEREEKGEEEWEECIKRADVWVVDLEGVFSWEASGESEGGLISWVGEGEQGSKGEREEEVLLVGEEGEEGTREVRGRKD